MRCFVVTGATSGLGLEAVRKLAAADRNNVILVGARAPERANNLRRAAPSDQLWISALDTSSLDSVARFADAVVDRLDGAAVAGLALNAGVQIVSGKKRSADGYELTFATNVLGHVALYRSLEPHLSSSSVVVSTASGTHDEDHEQAKPYGFRGGFFPSAEAVAEGDVAPADTDRQAGLDRYATSKLCNLLFTYAMARRRGEAGPRFLALDPGLMPGTGLARDHSRAIQIAWKTVLPQAARFMDGASSPKRSGAVLADLLLQDAFGEGAGLYVDFTRRPIESSKLSYDEAAQDALIAFADAVIAARNPPAGVQSAQDSQADEAPR